MGEKFGDWGDRGENGVREGENRVRAGENPHSGSPIGLLLL
jgi:hypothetical protein